MMMEESSIFFKDNFNESSATLLPSQQNNFIDPILSEISLHDEENNLHLVISHHDNTLNFSILQILKNDSEKINTLKITPLLLSEDTIQIIQTNYSNIQPKQIKMIRLNKNPQGHDEFYSSSEPASPSFAKEPHLPELQLQPQFSSNCSAISKQTYIVGIVLEQQILGLSFNIVSQNNNKNQFSHTIEQMRFERIELEGIITDIHLNREKEQIIVSVNQQSLTKVQLIDKIFSSLTKKDIAQFAHENERMIGNLGVSADFSIIRIIVRVEKDLRKFFMNTYHISQLGLGAGLKIDLNKRPFSSIMNENNYKTCTCLFSQSCGYLTLSDSFNMEVYDFNNHSAKSIIKELISKQSQSSSSATQTNNSQKLIYNLDKSTLLIANSSINQCISIYSLDNPISVLESLNTLGIQSHVPIKRVVISQPIQKQQMPCSASNLMDMYSNMKSFNQNSNYILILVLLADEMKTIVPIIIDKENLESKLPELKYVSSQITNYNYNNQDDSINYFNDFEIGFNKSKNYDSFKTPDRKASINQISSSLENSKFLFSSSHQINHNNSAHSNHLINTCQSQKNVSAIYPNSFPFNQFQNSRQSLGQNCENGGNLLNRMNSSQEINWCRNSQGQKRIWNGNNNTNTNGNNNNNRTLFNENSNSISVDDVIFSMQKSASLKNDANASSLFDKISPTQTKIEEAINSSDSEEYNPIIKSRVDTFDPTSSSSPLLSQIKHQNRIRDSRGVMRRKDISRITMKFTPDNIPAYIFQRAEVSQDDLIEQSQPLDNKKNISQNPVAITINSQTQSQQQEQEQDDIEDTYAPFIHSPSATDYQNKRSNLSSSKPTQSNTATASHSLSTAISKFDKINRSNINNNLVSPIVQNGIKEFLSNDSETIKKNCQDFSMFQQEKDYQQFASRSQPVKKNNNIFNKHSFSSNSTSARKNKQEISQFNQKGISSFLSPSPSPQSLLSKQQQQPTFNYPQRNIFHQQFQQSQQQQQQQLLQASSFFNKSQNLSSNIMNHNQLSQNTMQQNKPQNNYTQTKLFSNEQKFTLPKYTNFNSLHQIGKQLFKDDSSHQSNNNNNSATNNSNKNNNNNIQQKQSKQQQLQMTNIQSLLVKRRSPYQIQQQQLSSSSLGCDPIKINKKSD